MLDAGDTPLHTVQCACTGGRCRPALGTRGVPEWPPGVAAAGEMAQHIGATAGASGLGGAMAAWAGSRGRLTWWAGWEPAEGDHSHSGTRKGRPSTLEAPQLCLPRTDILWQGQQLMVSSKMPHAGDPASGWRPQQEGSKCLFSSSS